MNRWIGAKDDLRRVRCSTQDFCSHVSRRVRFRVQGRPLFPISTATKPLSTLEWMVTMLWVQLQAEGRMQSNTDKSCNSLHRSSEYLAKSQPSISRCGTHWLLGHRSEEIYALHSQQWRHIRLVQPRPYISTVSIDKTSAGPLHLVLSARTTIITRRLKKPASYLSTMITIRVEMTPLITQESHSDYQPTSILTHANSATTLTVLQRPGKIAIVDFTGCACSPIPPWLWEFLQNETISPWSNMTTSVH